MALVVPAVVWWLAEPANPPRHPSLVFVLADRKWSAPALAAVGPALPGPARHPPAGVPPVGVRRAEGEAAREGLCHRFGRESRGEVCLQSCWLFRVSWEFSVKISYSGRMTYAKDR